MLECDVTNISPWCTVNSLCVNKYLVPRYIYLNVLLLIFVVSNTLFSYFACLIYIVPITYHHLDR